MKIILIRHGDAGAYTHPDSERNLSELGKRQANQTAEWLKGYAEKNGSPDLFISSPYNRAVQTCQIIKQKFANVEHIIFDKITPYDDAKLAIDGLSDLLENIADNATVVIVCHMNIIAYMASILTGEPPYSFSLAEARVFEMPVVADGLATQIAQFIPH
ncbi:phosphohistidine phosphatase SixA [Faucicola mancuniensis]|uniref:phosphohistidine phosphatase SixA n=1 Tax=Faucicola mancuniensis TaxID=1309795 RepID=UPI0039774205